MATIAVIKEAERWAQKQRLEHAQLLHFTALKCRAGDPELAQRVLAAAKADPAAYDRALADPRVNDLFSRGVLFFAKATP